MIGDINPCADNIIKLELTSILSAMASTNLPKSVTMLFFLAIQPSRKSVNDAIANKILRDNDLNVTDKDDLEDVKDAIGLTWENKKEILDPSTINDISEKQNGINFKQFIFCEEYLKRGKIKPTCEHLGISRNTAYLWLKDDKVQEYLKNRQDEIKKETDDTFIQTYRASFNQLNKMI